MESVEAFILSKIRESTNQEVSRSDDLATVGLDSVSMAELTYEIEKQFRIRVGEDIIDVATIGEMIEYVEARLAKTAS